jgi:hypothetical protein
MIATAQIWSHHLNGHLKVSGFKLGHADNEDLGVYGEMSFVGVRSATGKELLSSFSGALKDRIKIKATFFRQELFEMLNLGTCILLILLRDELNERERRLIQATPVVISAVVLWELWKLATRRKIEFDLDGVPEVEIFRSSKCCRWT